MAARLLIPSRNKAPATPTKTIRADIYLIHSNITAGLLLAAAWALTTQQYPLLGRCHAGPFRTAGRHWRDYWGNLPQQAANAMAFLAQPHICNAFTAWHTMFLTHSDAAPEPEQNSRIPNPNWPASTPPPTALWPPKRKPKETPFTSNWRTRSRSIGQADFIISRRLGRDITNGVRHHLSSPGIQRLLDAGQARYAVRISCADTRIRSLHSSATDTQTITRDEADYLGPANTVQPRRPADRRQHRFADARHQTGCPA